MHHLMLMYLNILMLNFILLSRNLIDEQKNSKVLKKIHNIFRLVIYQKLKKDRKIKLHYLMYFKKKLLFKLGY